MAAYCCACSLLPQLPRLLHQRLTENPAAGIEQTMLLLLKQQKRRNTWLAVIAGILLVQLLLLLLG